MVAILYKPTQNAMLLLYYMNKHKTRYGYYISYNQTQNAIWLLYYINKHTTQYGCYII